MTGLIGALIEAWSEFRVHKARVLLSLVGVAVAVCALTGVAGLGTIATQAQIEQIAETVPGGMANIQDIYPLAPLQEGVLFYHRFHQDNDPYVTRAVISFDSQERFACSARHLAL